MTEKTQVTTQKHITSAIKSVEHQGIVKILPTIR